MNSSSYPIRAIFFTKNRIIGEQIFPNNLTFGQLKKYFYDYLSKGTFLLFNKYFINSKELKDSDLISQNFKQDKNTKLYEILLAIELKENEDKKISLINSNLYKEEVYGSIIQPKQNPFGLIVFFFRNKKIQFEEYPYNYLQNFGLDFLNKNFAYCNSYNALYLSGGENSNNSNLPLNDFWIINHKNYAISRKKMPVQKKNHSMIYIPNFGSKLGSVFIIGGENLKTLVYDIKNGIFYYWGNMIDFHSSPALLLYGEYLYCFNSLNDKNTFFEKTYLGRNSRKMWEKVYIRFKDINPCDFYNNDFAVSKSIENNIIFFGGKNADKKTFIFNPLNNTIIKTDGDNEKIIFEDKNFYKLNKLINIAIPSNFEQKQELVLLNKYNYSIIKTKYKLGQKNSNNDLTSSIESIHDLFIDSNEKGNISLQAKFLSLNETNQNNFFLRTIGKPVFEKINNWISVKQPQRFIKYQPSTLLNTNNLNNRYDTQQQILVSNNQ